MNTQFFDDYKDKYLKLDSNGRIKFNNNIIKCFMGDNTLFPNYKFDINENTTDKNAITPEILGYVFENTLSSTDRKSKGVFYTPKEIVNYMCCESLYNYIKGNLCDIKEEELRQFVFESVTSDNIIMNKDKLNELLLNIKVIDPSVGSGAFLIGMLDKLSKCINLLSNDDVVHIKKRIIMNCLYGIDISSEAIDICKTRLKLSVLDNVECNLIIDNALLYDYRDIKFDIVIGNPPYIDSEEMTKKIPKERELYKKIYSCAKGNWDIFIPFIENGYKLLKESGVISYIVPNKLIGAKYSQYIKEYMMQYQISTLRDYSEVEVFKTADVYPVIFIAEKIERKKQYVIAEIMKDVLVSKTHFEIDKEMFYKDIYWDKFFSENSKEVSLILKLLGNKKLIDFVSIKGSATVGEAYEIKKVLVDNSSQIATNQEIKFINTGTIDRYKVLWGINDTQYIKGKYKYPIIAFENLEKISVKRVKEAKSEKIVVAGMTKEIEAIYDNGIYLSGKSTQLLLKKEEKIDLKYILSLINSKLLTFFFKKLFNSLSMSGGFFTIGKEQLSNLPIKIDKNQEKYIEMVDRIIELKKLNKDTQELEEQIDEMVYDLYELTEEEKEIVRKA